MTIERDTKGKILPGSGGRPAGARNKLQADFLHALQEDFEEHGIGVIRIVRAERPTEYLKIVASIPYGQNIETIEKTVSCPCPA